MGRDGLEVDRGRGAGCPSGPLRIAGKAPLGLAAGDKACGLGRGVLVAAQDRARFDLGLCAFTPRCVMRHFQAITKSPRGQWQPVLAARSALFRPERTGTESGTGQNPGPYRAGCPFVPLFHLFTDKYSYIESRSPVERGLWMPFLIGGYPWEKAEQRNKRNKPSPRLGSTCSGSVPLFRFQPFGSGTDTARLLLLMPLNRTLPAFVAPGRRASTVLQLWAQGVSARMRCSPKAVLAISRWPS